MPAHVKNILRSVDEEVFVDVTVTNVGDATGEYILALMANRTKAAAGKVRLNPSESKVVRMSARLMGGIQTITNPFTQPDRGISYLLEVAENKTSVGLGLIYEPSATPVVGTFPDYSLYFYALDVFAVAFTIWITKWSGAV